MASQFKKHGRRLKNKAKSVLSAQRDPLGRKPEDIQMLERKAKELWHEGHKRQALDFYRLLAVTTYPSARRWMTYAQRAMALGEGHQAALALQSVLDLNPANVTALELLEESVFHLDLKGVSIVSRLGALAESYSEGKVSLGDAYDMFTPRKYDRGLSLLARSDDPAAQRLISLNSVSLEDLTDLVDNAANMDGSAQRLLMKRLLAYNAAAQAKMVAEDMAVTDIPIDSLRRAIRRLLRAGDAERAKTLLSLYLKVEPEDTWAQSKFKDVDSQIARKGGVLSAYQLRKEGFPVPSRKVIPAYEANPATVLYALHNALPHNSAGYATRTHGLLSSLRKTGWDIEGVTRYGYPYDMPGGDQYGELPEVEHVDGVPYRHLSTTPEIPKKKPLQNYVDQYRRRLQWMAKDKQPFVLHAASNHWNGLAAVVAARKLGIPSIYEVRGLWEVTRGSRNPEWAEGGMYKFIAAMERDAATKADRVITITQALADELVERGVDSEKITIVPNGVDAERFKPIVRNEELAESLGITGKTVIGYVGSILDYEGIDMLLDAAAILKERRDDFTVLLVGDGAERVELEHSANQRGLDDVVIFTGRVPHEEVESYYSLIDIAPFPRHALPVCEMVSPLKPLEAMAMEKAVIGSNVRAIEEMIAEGKTGLLHEKDDVESLVDSIEKLLDDPELRSKMGKNAREWVVRERNWDTLTQRVSDVYRELGGVC